MSNPKENTRITPQVTVESRQFFGFAPPTSNTTYTPNQFFDVCLPHYSRGCVRLVAYMLRRSLGWCDADGNPQEDQLVISYNDLVQNAGISRGAIADSVEEAIRANFITCLRRGRSKAANTTAVSPLYELKWHTTSEYVKDPTRFQGFFEGEGNRTDIPNQFFDICVRNESLAVIKVVGSIIRFSIGFQAHRGSRRQQVAMSYTDIQRYAKISVRRHLADALQQALEQNYVVRISQGLFTHDKDRQISTTYAVKWLDKGPYPYIGSKKTPDKLDLIGSKKTPEERFKKDTRIGSKRTPEDRFKKDTSIQMKQINETLKQQQDDPLAAEQKESIDFLIQNGFSARDAQVIAATNCPEGVRQQVEWLPLRKPGVNPLGLLRRAIEQNWPTPVNQDGRNSDTSLGSRFAAFFYAGKAGNDELPIASPSGNEVNLCNAFLENLFKICPEENRVEEWGRDFGSMVAAETRGKRDFTVTLVYALRNYGDTFMTRVKSERSRRDEELIKQARQQHHRAFMHAYRSYVEGQEERLRSERPEDYAAFEIGRASTRQSIEQGRWYRDEEQRTDALRRFDSNRQRLLGFLEYFSADILDFWQWDKTLNTESFSEGKVLV